MMSVSGRMHTFHRGTVPLKVLGFTIFSFLQFQAAVKLKESEL